MTSEQTDKLAGLYDRLAKLPDEFSDFSHIYQTDIEPALKEKEADRQAAWRKARMIIAAGVIIGGLIALGGFYFFRSIFPIAIGAMAGFGLGNWGYSGVRAIGRQAKQIMVQPIAQRFGLTYNELASPAASTHLDAARGLDLVPRWDRKHLEDEIIGERNGNGFEFFEAHLEQRRTTRDSRGNTQTKWVTVFHGQCWIINSPKTFHGTTKVSRDSGLFNALGAMGSKWSRAKLEDPVFEKVWEVYTTDQVESRYLLTPDVMQALVELEAAFKSQKLRCAFHEDRIYVAAEGGDLFEPGSMMKSLDDPNRVGELLEDFARVFHLIDELGK